MKIRTGFVSNSSSSSFVCDVCREEFSGWDLSLSKVDHAQCINGHTICQDSIINSNSNTTESDEDEDDYYEIPAEKCPICQMQVLADSDIIAYAVKQAGGMDKLRDKLKSEFKNYEELRAFLRNKD